MSQPTGVGVGVEVGRAFCKHSVIGQGMKNYNLKRERVGNANEGISIFFITGPAVIIADWL